VWITSPDQIFWKTVEAWKIRQARISIKCSQQPCEREVIGTVSEVNESSVTFLETVTDQEVTMDFKGAEIRIQPFDLIDAVAAFATIWQPEGEPFVSCVFTELVDPRKPI
jgi:hypothetical protein